MGQNLEVEINDVSQLAKLIAYDISATFGDEQPGRIKKRLVDKKGKFCLDTQAWEAGDVAYQKLKKTYPQGITLIEFKEAADQFLLMACNYFYPEILNLAEAGKLEVKPFGVDGIKEAWADWDWCERILFVSEVINVMNATEDDLGNPFDAALPLVLLQKLDDAVIAEILDGRGLPDVMLEIGSLRDRLKPPQHVQKIIEASHAVQAKLDSFKQARRKGADAIHTENRAMKAEVFEWLDSKAKFKSNEAAAMAITGRVPIAHVTARDWYKEWKKLRSASTP